MRIERGSTTVFATGINKPIFGSTTLTYTFDKEGEYILYTRFENEREAIVEGKQKFVVYGSNNKGPFIIIYIIFILTGIIVGATGMYALKYINKKRKLKE